MRPGRRRSAASASLVAALVAALVVLTLGASAAPTVRMQGASPPSVTTAARSSAAPTASATVPATPSGATRRSIPAAAPRLLEIPQLGLRATITPFTSKDVEAHGGAVKPPTLWTVSWWTGAGRPGTDSTDTVYLYGHTWREPAVFNRLKELSAGSRVQVTTSAGRLTYVVDRCLTVDKDDLASHPEVTRREPGRLLLIGCYRRTGREWSTTHNLVVAAHLVR